MRNLLKTLIVPAALAFAVAPVAQAQTMSEKKDPPVQTVEQAKTTDDAPRPKASIAAEADILSYFVSGYSGIVNVSLANGFQVALGAGRYDVPTFLLEGDENYEKAKWEATATSIQVLRMTYRFKGPRQNGPALGAIVMNQNWTLSSEPLSGETKFKQVNAGITGGYYLHLGKHLYLYPTAAFTYNNVYSGSTSVKGTSYTVAKFSPNASLHMGWEF